MPLQTQQCRQDGMLTDFIAYGGFKTNAGDMWRFFLLRSGWNLSMCGNRARFAVRTDGNISDGGFGHLGGFAVEVGFVPGVG